MRVESILVEDSRPLRHAVLRPHQPLEVIAGHEPPGAVAYAAFEDGEQQPIAVGLVGRDGGPDVWRVRGMATEPEARGRGAGSAVLRALILYERCGFVVVSEQFEIETIGPHYRMELKLSRQ
jgi:GNAT superfamily N-acetyltransferase